MSARPPTVRAYLMAAGLGTRLYPLTGPHRPSPWCPSSTVRSWSTCCACCAATASPRSPPTCTTTRTRSAPTSATAAQFGVELRYNLEEHLLGTAGGADAFREFLGDDTFLVMSGDGLTDIDLTRVPGRPPRARRHRHHGRQGGRRPVAATASWCTTTTCASSASRRSRRARRRCSHAVQLRHLRVRAGDLRLHRRRAPSSTGPRTSSRRCSRPTRPFHCWQLETYWNDVGNIEQYRLRQLRRPARAGGRSTCPAASCAAACGSARAREIEAGVRLRSAADPARRRLPRSSPAPSSSARSIIGDGCVVERRRRARGRHPLGRRQGGRATRASPAASSAARCVVHHEAVVHEDAVIGDRSRRRRRTTPSSRPARGSSRGRAWPAPDGPTPAAART